jgi:hypothetical protein
VSISILSSASLLDNLLRTASITGTTQTFANNANPFNPASTSNTIPAVNTPAAEPDVLTQDVINLLKDLTTGDLSGARDDLAKFKTDLKTQTAPATANNLARDATSLVKDLASGNNSAARKDVTNIATDLQAQDPAAQTNSPLEGLVVKISDALSSGVLQGTAQQLAAYLVQNGQAQGNLLNTFA